MNAIETINRNAHLARKLPEHTHEMMLDSIHAGVALSALIAAAEIGASELIRAGKSAAGNALLSAVSHFREPAASTSGVLKGNADLVPAQHAYLPGDKL